MKKLELGQSDLFTKYFSANPPQISEHTFTNLFIWQRHRPIELLETWNSLIVLAKSGEGYTIFGPPAGPISNDEAIAQVRSQIQGTLLGIERLPLALNIAGWETTEDRNNFDYVYRRENLAELAGRRYHGKRNLVTQCLVEYDCAYEEISPANIGDVRAMMDRWCISRECGKDRSLCAEYEAVRELFDNYPALGVTGAAIRIAGKVEAFTVGEALNQTTAVIHFEKASPEFKGLYQLVNQWFCKNALSRFEYINREQDLGVEGLRKAKESYFPDHLVKKYGAWSANAGPLRASALQCTR